MTVKWRHCAIAERDHRKDVRNYAHTYHYPQTICLAKDFWKLPREYRDGVLLHEIGHLLAGPDGSESDANDAVFDWAGAQIEYVDSPFGKRLERLSNMAGARIARRRRNPIANEDHLPYDQWIPSHAVKFNSDGTVDLMTEGEHNPRRNAKPDLIELINTYNDASDPAAYRTDDEHAIESERARDALRAIRQHYTEGVDYKELSNGALWPIRHNAGMVQNRSVARAFFDDQGVFHPIRKSPDYSYKYAGEKKPKHPRKSKAQKFY